MLPGSGCRQSSVTLYVLVMISGHVFHHRYITHKGNYRITVQLSASSVTSIIFSCRHISNTLNSHRSRIRCCRIDIITNCDRLCHQDLVVAIICYTICSCDYFRTSIAIITSLTNATTGFTVQLSASSVTTNNIRCRHISNTLNSHRCRIRCRRIDIIQYVIVCVTRIWL